MWPNMAHGSAGKVSDNQRHVRVRDLLARRFAALSGAASAAAAVGFDATNGICADQSNE